METVGMSLDMTVEDLIMIAAAGPGVYGFICWLRRSFHARKVARGLRETYREEWNSLHWVARRNPLAGIEVLISKGLISGPEVDDFIARDEYLEKATWIGLLISAVLLLVIALWKYAASVLG